MTARLHCPPTFNACKTSDRLVLELTQAMLSVLCRQSSYVSFRLKSLLLARPPKSALGRYISQSLPAQLGSHFPGTHPSPMRFLCLHGKGTNNKVCGCLFREPCEIIFSIRFASRADPPNSSLTLTTPGIRIANG